MLEDLKALCACRGVSGDEAEVREYILSRVAKVADDVMTDTMGNVIVFKKGAKSCAKKIAVCAHMDEVGLVVTMITDDGYLKFATVGSLDSRVIVGKTVAVGKQNIIGIIGCKAIHFLKEGEREKAIAVEDLYIDIGAESREEAEKQVELGDSCVFDSQYRQFGSGYIKAKAIDDRFGCAVMLQLIESDLPIDCTFAFTVQEEVGLRGAYTAAYRVKPDIALIIEGTTAADLPSVQENKKACKSGGGAVIPFMDKMTIYDRELYSTLTKIADENGVKWQTKTAIAGGTDGGAFQRSGTGVKTAAIAAPVRNLHSPSCVAKLSDLEQVGKLAALFLEEMGRQA